MFTGAYAINPLTGKKLPIWIADYVLSSYGTGAVMVPAHDERDYEFASKFNLPINEVIGGDIQKKHTGVGEHINSGELNGLDNETAISKAIELLVAKGAGEKKVNYKLRDWLLTTTLLGRTNTSYSLGRWYYDYSSRRRVTTFTTRN